MWFLKKFFTFELKVNLIHGLKLVYSVMIKMSRGIVLSKEEEGKVYVFGECVVRVRETAGRMKRFDTAIRNYLKLGHNYGKKG